jgi:Raf kinase inhibitor-like YbhB/YbcL family protein
MGKISFVLVLFVFFIILWVLPLTDAGAGMILSSPDFKNSEYIPDKFTCKGADVNPALDISNIPPDAKSLAIIVDDPDAPSGVWTHWIMYDIAVLNRIEENNAPGILGINDFGKKSYGGPCPPYGTHRYFFKVYALDRKLNLFGLIDKATLERNMMPYILDKAQIYGIVKK